MSFLFTIAVYTVILVTLAVSCVMDVRSLAVAVAKFAMLSTVFWWRYLSSKFSVALCAAP